MLVYPISTVKNLFEYIRKQHYTQIDSIQLPPLYEAIQKYRNDLLLAGLLVTGCKISHLAQFFNLSRGMLNQNLKCCFNYEELKLFTIIQNQANSDSDVKQARINLSDLIKKRFQQGDLL